MSRDNLKKQLSGVLSGKILIVGIGNQLKSDDGFGPALINRLQGRVQATCLDTGLSPENYIGKIIKLNCDVVLIVDAVSMDEAPGTLKLIDAEQIPLYGFSTHNMSPKLMIENIQSQVPAKIFMLGAQPKSIEFGEQISIELNEAIDFLEGTLIEILN